MGARAHSSALAPPLGRWDRGDADHGPSRHSPPGRRGSLHHEGQSRRLTLSTVSHCATASSCSGTASDTPAACTTRQWSSARRALPATAAAMPSVPHRSMPRRRSARRSAWQCRWAARSRRRRADPRSRPGARRRRVPRPMRGRCGGAAGDDHAAAREWDVVWVHECSPCPGGWGRAGSLLTGVGVTAGPACVQAGCRARPCGRVARGHRLSRRGAVG